MLKTYPCKKLPPDSILNPLCPGRYLVAGKIEANIKNWIIKNIWQNERGGSSVWVVLTDFYEELITWNYPLSAFYQGLPWRLSESLARHKRRSSFPHQDWILVISIVWCFLPRVQEMRLRPISRITTVSLTTQRKPLPISIRRWLLRDLRRVRLTGRR